MTKVYFDKMEVADLDTVYQLELDNYPVPWSKGVLRDCIKAGYHCVLLKSKVDEQLLGYAFLMTAYDESHLLNMCIKNDQQGKGLGRKLLRYLENICLYNQSKLFLLEVRESNPVAQHLYRSCGFQQVGIRKNYYRCVNGRENAIVMTKKI
jgi:ribosomal-protein-alanine N-acetyltransferase